MEGEHNQIDVSFENLNYRVQTKEGERKILNNISGIFKSGQVNCIMGASGAGKTSLLNIVALRIKNSKAAQIDGKLQVNGQKYDQKQFNSYSAYVMQSDILMGSLTVKESLMFYANLKFIGTQQEKEQKVQEIMKKFKLVKCQDTPIGGNMIKGVSGGERKRTNIACELITNPDLILLDEPTSGLDSFTAFLIIKVLKDYARTNKTVIFTIHQPNTDIYELFDRLTLLVEGKLIYQGDAQKAIHHFKSIGYECPLNCNPSDYFMDIMHPLYQPDTKDKRYQMFYEQYDQKFKAVVEQELEDKSTSEIKRQTKTNSFMYETKQVAWRTIMTQKRNPIVFKGRVGQAIILGLLSGLLYFQTPQDPFNQRAIQNLIGGLFFITTNVFMSALNPVLLTFAEERVVFLKEVNAQLYGVMSYYVGKTFPELLPTIVVPLITGCIQYWMIGFNSSASQYVLNFLLISVLHCFAGVSFGYALASAIPDVKTVQAIAPLLFIPLMLFSGYYSNSESLAVWVSWIEHISPFKYAFEGYITNQFEDIFTIMDPINKLSLTLGVADCCLYLFIIGMILRLVALINLKLSVRNLQ